MSKAVDVQLTDNFRNLLAMFLKHREKITGVRFCGLDDLESWKNDHPSKRHYMQRHRG